MSIDPVEYGKLVSSVKHLEDDVSAMRDDIKALVALANRSKGGLWAGMTLASVFGAVFTFVVQFFVGK